MSSPSVSHADAATPTGASLRERIESRIVRSARHAPDWSVSHTWAAVDPKYRRALIRCIDPSGAVGAAGEQVIPAEHFTLFMETFPPGCEGGLHTHPDAEEVYVVLEGQGVRLRFECNGETYETQLHRHDVASVPPGLFRVVVNDGPDDALVLVVFGSGRPEKARLSPTHPLANLAAASK
jgi:quercetin dioxygenase-like cupin family protein